MIAPAIAPGGPAETPTMAPTRAPDAPPSASCAVRRLAVSEDGVPRFLLIFIALLLARGSRCVRGRFDLRHDADATRVRGRIDTVVFRRAAPGGGGRAAARPG